MYILHYEQLVNIFFNIFVYTLPQASWYIYIAAPRTRIFVLAVVYNEQLVPRYQVPGVYYTTSTIGSWYQVLEVLHHIGA